MAAQAGKGPSAFPKTAALAEVERLVTRVPGIVPVRIVTRRGRLAMARSARLVERCRRQAFRISDRCLSSLQPDVLGPGTVTGLALYSGLERHNSRSLRQFQRPGRMTLKAAQDGRTGIERSVSLSRRGPVARRQRHSFRLLEVSQPVFEVIILVQMADESNRLLPRAKGPVTETLRKSRSQRMFRWVP